MEKKIHIITTYLLMLFSVYSYGYGNNSEQPPLFSKGTVPLIRLSANFSDTPYLTDCTVIYFNDNATYEFDGQLDAFKFMNSDVMVPSFFSVTPYGTNLSINGLPPISDPLLKVALGLKIDRSGEITLKIKDIEASLSGSRIFLTDIVTGIEKDLLPNLEYRIHLSQGEYKDRFFINMSGVITGVPENSPDDFFNIYSSDGKITTEINNLPGNDGTIRIYSFTGQTVFSTRVYEPGYHEFYANPGTGIYFASFTSGKVNVTRKIFIKGR